MDTQGYEQVVLDIIIKPVPPIKRTSTGNWFKSKELIQVMIITLCRLNNHPILWPELNKNINCEHHNKIIIIKKKVPK